MENKARCSTCGDTDIQNFYWVRTINKYHNYCKLCDRIHKKEYYQKNKKRLQEVRKKWQEDNKELHAKHCKKYRETEKYKEWYRLRQERKKQEKLKKIKKQ